MVSITSKALLERINHEYVLVTFAFVMAMADVSQKLRAPYQGYIGCPSPSSVYLAGVLAWSTSPRRGKEGNERPILSMWLCRGFTIVRNDLARDTQEGPLISWMNFIGG